MCWSFNYCSCIPAPFYSALYSRHWKTHFQWVYDLFPRLPSLHAGLLWVLPMASTSRVWPETWAAFKVSAEYQKVGAAVNPSAEPLLDSGFFTLLFYPNRIKEFPIVINIRDMSTSFFFYQPVWNFPITFSVFAIFIMVFAFRHGWWVIHWEIFHERWFLVILEKERTACF